MPTTTTPSIDQLKRAIAVAEQIEKLQAELNQIFGGGGANASTPIAVKDPRKGKRSAAVRARMAAAQKARWAKSKGTQAPTAAMIGKIAKIEATAPKAKKKQKRNISPEAKARMVEAVKRRWAKQKAAKAPTAKSKARIAQAGQPSFEVL